jgi:hypothetical protein
MSAVMKNILPSKSKAARSSPQAPAAFLVERKYYDDAVALGNAKFINTILPWIALGNLELKQATGADWNMLQYWLYYAEELWRTSSFESVDERKELAVRIYDSIQALYSIGRRYKASDYTLMDIMPDEYEAIRDGLLIGDELKSIVNELGLLTVGRTVAKILGVPPGQ